MSTPFSKSEKAIQQREDVLREWFTQGKDSITRIIGGLDIDFGEEGVKETLSDAFCVLQPGGFLILLDEFPFSRFANLLSGLPFEAIDHAQRSLDVH